MLGFMRFVEDRMVWHLIRHSAVEDAIVVMNTQSIFYRPLREQYGEELEQVVQEVWAANQELIGYEHDI